MCLILSGILLISNSLWPHSLFPSLQTGTESQVLCCSRIFGCNFPQLLGALPALPLTAHLWDESSCNKFSCFQQMSRHLFNPPSLLSHLGQSCLAYRSYRNYLYLYLTPRQAFTPNKGTAPKPLGHTGIVIAVSPFLVKTPYPAKHADGAYLHDFGTSDVHFGTLTSNHPKWVYTDR